MAKVKLCEDEHTSLTGNPLTQCTHTKKKKREEEEIMREQARIFTASAAGSTCATSDLLDVSVKSASQVAA